MLGFDFTKKLYDFPGHIFIRAAKAERVEKIVFIFFQLMFDGSCITTIRSISPGHNISPSFNWFCKSRIIGVGG